MAQSIEVHGKRHNIVECLGSGVCTRAYRLKSGKVLCITNSDPSKTILLAVQKHKNPHIPKLRQISKENFSVAYRMPEYKTFSDWEREDKTPAILAIGKSIRKMYSDWNYNWSKPYGKMSLNEKPLSFIEYLYTCDIPSTIVDALKLIVVEATSMKHSVGLDMHDGNWATTMDGETLILLDVVCA